MKEIISSSIIAAAILLSAALYFRVQPKYEFEIISSGDTASSWNSVTVRTNLRTGERCLMLGEGLLAMPSKDWKQFIYELAGPTKVCEIGVHWRQLPTGE
jgi:hypothetical protein